MSNNHYETNYSKQYKKKLSKKETTLHTISVELKKTPNILYNNYQSYNNNQIKIINVTNNNNNNQNHGKNKIFKNIKLYEVSKQPNFIKKRNIKTKKINGIPFVSLTEINTNIKKALSNNYNTNINNNQNNNNFNHTINLYHKNYHSSNKNIIKINKALVKSKSNKFIFTPSQYYNIQSRNKHFNNTLMKSNTNSGCGRSYNNSNNKKIVNSKINKYHINFSPLCSNHTISNITQKNYKLNENRKQAGSSEDKVKIQKLIKEKENKEKEIKLKDKIIKEQENIINLLKQNEIQMKEQIQIVNDKYEDIKIKYQTIIDENIVLKNKINEDEKNINFLKEKELKLMRMLYLLKEKGIDINTILNEVKNESNNESINKSEILDENNLKNSSNLTVYFPDKINMKNIMETKEAKNVPKIDFNQIPEYSFQSDEEKQNNFDEEMPNQDEFNINEIGFQNYGMNDFRRNSA